MKNATVTVDDRKNFWIYEIHDDGDTLTWIKTDPKGVFLPPIGAFTELQAVAFYVKRVLMFEGSEEENRAKLLEFRAIPTTLGVDKYVQPTVAPVLTSKQGQGQLFPEINNAQLL